MKIRRPLIGICLTVMLGIWCAVILNAVSLVWLLIALFLSFLAAIAFELVFRFLADETRLGTIFIPRSLLPFASLSSFFLFTTVFLLACSTTSLKYHNPSKRSLDSFMEKPRESVEMTGIVCDDPVKRTYENSDRVYCTFPIYLESVRRLVPWQRARGKLQVRLTLKAGERSPQYGELWHFAGVLTDKARFSTTLGLSPSVLSWIRTRYTLTADPTMAFYISGKKGISLRRWCFKMRGRCAECLTYGISHRPDVIGLVQAILLGYRHQLQENLRANFIATGTYYIFAISGQHVAIISLFIIVLIQSYGISRPKWFFFVAPLLILFTLSTGMRSSAVRGCLMALLCFLGPLVMRKTDVPSALALAALIILAVVPFQLFDYGFILSFSVVTGLIIIAPAMLSYIRAQIAPDPFRLQPERKAVRLFRRFTWILMAWLAFSLSAWLVSMPLIAHWFHLVSPVALIANVLIIPLVTLILLSGCLSIFSGLIFPLISEIFNFTNVALVSLLISYINFLARLRFGHFYIESFPLWLVIVWLATLLALILRRIRLFVLGVIAMILVLTTGLILSRNDVHMDFINIDGSSIGFVNAPGADDILINAGSHFRGHALVRYLRSRGVDSLKALVLANADSRHVGGALVLLKSMPIKELWCASTSMRSPVFKKVIALASENGVCIRTLIQGASGMVSPELFWEVLHPLPKEKYNSAEAASLVLAFTRCGKSVVFMGSSSESVKRQILKISPCIKPDLLMQEEKDSSVSKSRNERQLNIIHPLCRLFCTQLIAGNEFSDSSFALDSHAGTCLDLPVPPNTGISIDWNQEHIQLQRFVIEK